MLFVVAGSTAGSHPDDVRDDQAERFGKTFEDLVIKGAAGCIAMNEDQQGLGANVLKIYHMGSDTHWLSFEFVNFYRY